MAHGLGHGWSGAVVAAWPAVSLIGSYELLLMIIRSAQASDDSAGQPGESGREPDPLDEQAAILFADEIATAGVPSIRAIRAQLHVGQPRAQRIQGHLAALDGGGLRAEVQATDKAA